jgi:hypothetical protein
VSRSWLTRWKSVTGIVVVGGLALGGGLLAVRSSADSPATGPTSTEPPVAESSSTEPAVATATGQISSGEFAACATGATGSVECRGSQGWYRVDGVDDAIAVAVSTEWYVIWDPRYTRACVTHSDGTVSCWFPNKREPLGSNKAERVSGIEKIAGLSDSVAIAVGLDKSCALNGNGTVACWTRIYGQEDADPPAAQFSKPVQVSGISNATAISSECAVVDGGSIKCWSYFYTQGEASVTTLPGIADAISLSQGAGTMCIVHRNGRVSCGLTANGDPIYIDGVANAIGVSTYYWADDVVTENGVAEEWGTCVLLTGGAVSCWSKQRPTPTIVNSISNATSIAAGRFSSCATTAGGEISCWKTPRPQRP